MTRIIVCGCFGRLGAVICKLARGREDVTLAAGVDVAAEGSAAFPFFTDIEACDIPADVIFMCLPPQAVAGMLSILQYAVARKTPVVVCTTALPDEVTTVIQKASSEIAIMVSANLSLGVNLLAGLIKKAAKLLYDANFDIEIIEKHHNQKLDAPSGTAFLLADAANDALGGQMKYVTNRSADKTKRTRDEIGLHALRGGTITGEHSVVFAGLDEVVELTHIAQSRDVFGAGALKVAGFMKGKPAGCYRMGDLVDAHKFE